jgi:hypothetical protein
MAHWVSGAIVLAPLRGKRQSRCHRAWLLACSAAVRASSHAHRPGRQRKEGAAACGAGRPLSRFPGTAPAAAWRLAAPTLPVRPPARRHWLLGVWIPALLFLWCAGALRPKLILASPARLSPRVAHRMPAVGADTPPSAMCGTPQAGYAFTALSSTGGPAFRRLRPPRRACLHLSTPALRPVPVARRPGRPYARRHRVAAHPDGGRERRRDRGRRRRLRGRAAAGPVAGPAGHRSAVPRAGNVLCEGAGKSGRMGSCRTHAWAPLPPAPRRLPPASGPAARDNALQRAVCRPAH